MDKRIIVGLIAGLVVGLIEMLLFHWSYALLLIPALLGALIGFVQTKTDAALNRYLIGAAVGALFFIVIASQTGLWLDDILTGAITGAAITFIISLLNGKI
ncbi:MAG: hypothetical protein R2798_02305 [Chitinophagales bacterium]|nr:hypothetical protein [Bacteroidota bacterium]MCB9042155.1 hypothetical protein [Chitinophagales bacterium]